MSSELNQNTSNVAAVHLPETHLAAYRCALMEVQTKFKIFNEEAKSRKGSNPIEFVKTRIKSPESIAEKLVRKGYEPTAEVAESRIDDIAGARVVCHFQSDVYAMADALLRQDYINLVERIDYIANPKPNGYRALHLVIEMPVHMTEESEYVRVEVQFMTLSMNTWATLEHAIFYKKKNTGPMRSALEQELDTCARLSLDIDARMEAMAEKIRKELKSNI